MMPRTPRRPEEFLFGSRTRTLVLGFLAQASTPATGYAVARALSIGVSKVYPELKRLEVAGVVGSRRNVKGGKTFVLKDDDLRRFLLRRVPIMTSEEWFSPPQIARRRAAYERAREIKVKVPSSPVKPRKRPFEAEFRRPRSKERAVARLSRLPG